MKNNSKILCFSALLAIPFFVGGCASDGSALSALRENTIVHNAARAVLKGKTYDRAAIAARDGDDEALAASAEMLRKLDPTKTGKFTAIAEQMVQNATSMDMRAQAIKDQNQKQVLQAQADKKYRQALRVSPTFPSRNATHLNSLGYFLADRGNTKADFQTAERLTRESLKLSDQAVEAGEAGSPFQEPLAIRKYNRANTRDSLAWALFKQGKLQEAKAEQGLVLKEMNEILSPLGRKITGDLYFHMGEIERALKKPLEAVKNYRAALKSEPDHLASQRALASVSKNLPKTPLPEKSPPKAPPSPAPSSPVPPEGLAPQPDNSIPEDRLLEEAPPVRVMPRGTLEARAPERMRTGRG